ncbi:MAG: hypothetical protein HKO02_06590 [Hyphomonadaceae bacterium]|nr:hypothetical protein [Hyphomonadaceae bacterium]
MLAPSKETIDSVEILSALSDPDRLSIYLCVSRAGEKGILVDDISDQLGFVPRRTASALRWLQRVRIVDLKI